MQTEISTSQQRIGMNWKASPGRTAISHDRKLFCRLGVLHNLWHVRAFPHIGQLSEVAMHPLAQNGALDIKWGLAHSAWPACRERRFSLAWRCLLRSSIHNVTRMSTNHKVDVTCTKTRHHVVFTEEKMVPRVGLEFHMNGTMALTCCQEQ